ncbi:MAG: hypothetical protein AAGK97_06655 [Bacteroidota bacterium]
MAKKLLRPIMGLGALALAALLIPKTTNIVGSSEEIDVDAVKIENHIADGKDIIVRHRKATLFPGPDIMRVQIQNSLHPSPDDQIPKFIDEVFEPEQMDKFDQ